ncbi:HTH domain-containing protein [Anaerobacillus sp. HL2]|nr:HTH domain-containing protein [Anaerobacillus sp. HL2]
MELIYLQKTNVSRQVIVGDVSILKARNYPILATAQRLCLY